MANIIYRNIKSSIGNDLAIVYVRSNAIENTSVFYNRNELTIRFANVNKNRSIKSLLNECLEITIDKYSYSNGGSDGNGKVMKVIDSEIFSL